MNLRSILIPAVALGVGVGIGSIGAAQAVDPVVQTKTRTVTETVTEEVTPQSCRDVITHARAIGRLTARQAQASIDFVDATMPWPDLVQRAAYAGMDMDVAEIEAITADMEQITSDVDAVTVDVEQIGDELAPRVRKFNRAADACES